MKIVLKRILCAILALMAAINIPIQAGKGTRLSANAGRIATTRALANMAIPTTRSIVPVAEKDKTPQFVRSDDGLSLSECSKPSIFDISAKKAQWVLAAGNKSTIELIPKTNNWIIADKTYSKDKKSESSSSINWKKLSMFGIGGAAIGYVMKKIDMDEVEKILDVAKATINIEAFDHDLISEEITNAIVQIHVPSMDSWGSALIVQGKTNSMYVITAAHCIDSQQEIYIVKDGVAIEAVPVLVDSVADIAILLIHPRLINDYKKTTGYALSALTVDAISNTLPKRNEAVSIHGYPEFMRDTEQKPYHVEASLEIEKVKGLITIANKPFNITSTEFHSHQPKQELYGASGGPAIAIRYKKPVVVGVLTGGSAVKETPTFSLKRSNLYVAGVGELSDYVQQAEKKIYPSSVIKSLYHYNSESSNLDAEEMNVLDSMQICGKKIRTALKITGESFADHMAEKIDKQVKIQNKEYNSFFKELRAANRKNDYRKVNDTLNALYQICKAEEIDGPVKFFEIIAGEIPTEILVKMHLKNLITEEQLLLLDFMLEVKSNLYGPDSKEFKDWCYEAFAQLPWHEHEIPDEYQ